MTGDMNGWFVTSSGTAIGKTLVVCALTRALRRSGVPVRAVKPVITGFTPETADDSDTAAILAGLGLPVTGENIALVSPWRLTAPLSPDMAASREGRTLQVDEIAAFCRADEGDGAGDGTVLLVEGIGGVMVPLDDDCTVLDLMAAVGLPAILVVGSYLGTLSHTLTAAAALDGRNIELAAVVVSESEQSPVPLAETAAGLARRLAPTPVVAVPRLAAGDDASKAMTALISELGLGGLGGSTGGP